ncbi:MAG: RsmD family RNA methyltransferase, partial [Candidatus Kapaibacterium sp.]
VKSDVLSYLKYCDEKYNIIFSDAPYHMETGSQIISIVAERMLLEHEGFIILETEDKEEIEYPSVFTLVKQKSFGISKITILEFSNPLHPLFHLRKV